MKLKNWNILALICLFSVATFWALTSAFDTPTVAVQSLWTVSGLVGTGLTGWNLYDAIKDRDSQRKDGRNGDMMFMADEEIRIEFIRLSKMLVISFIGLFLLQSAPTITAAQRKALHIPQWSTASVVITAGLMWIVIATVLQAFIDRRIRQRLYSRPIKPTS